MNIECTSAPVISNGFIYYVKDNSIYKYDALSDEKSELKVNGYRLTGIDMDDYENIKVTGFDSSLNSFSGYLTKDNQIVLEPILTDGYLTYSLTSLN